jgi:molybdopterin-guanine dinucleotide biosynthesis protein A
VRGHLARFAAGTRSDFETQCYHFCVSCAGYLLVGGKSSRMGTHKALLPFRGNPLARSLAELLERAAGSVVLVGNPQLAPQVGYPAIPDLYPGEGPLGGILTALAHTACDWNLLVACDMPGLSAEFLTGLLEAADRSGADVLLPVGPGGLPEPLCAVYHRRSHAPLAAAFARGVRKIVAALEENAALAVCRWPVAEAGVFQNVNTPEDWSQWSPRYAAN